MLKRNLIYYLFIFVCCSIFVSCVSDIALKEQVPFFDLKTFFTSEVKRLSSLKKLRKTTSINGSKETKELEIIDFEKELKLFAESDINRIAWLDRYKVDSLLGENKQLRQLSYIALDDKLRTQRMQIYFSNQKLDSLIIWNETSTAVAKSRQYIIYKPKSGYQIRSIQSINFASTHELGVQVEFLD